jgi:hypothetical protein
MSGPFQPLTADSVAQAAAKQSQTAWDECSGAWIAIIDTAIKNAEANGERYISIGASAIQRCAETTQALSRANMERLSEHYESNGFRRGDDSAGWPSAIRCLFGCCASPPMRQAWLDLYWLPPPTDNTL